ncbi:hypothetical protein [Streptomyces sp. NPDC020681]|uniref:hypothetical protein n=1 Tax=Streptomyces sp. NPDC020681 TaxID=3365083 RepID=UPI003799FC61
MSESTTQTHVSVTQQLLRCFTAAMVHAEVALISAGAALAGVAVSGGISLLRARQDRLDKQADREEQRRTQRLETRRAAYVAFLEAVTAIEDALEAIGSFEVPATREEFDRHGLAENATLTAFVNRVMEVIVAGPSEMEMKAKGIWESIVDLVGSYDNAFEAHRTDSDRQQLEALVERDHRVMRNRLSNRRSAFAAAAREQLGTSLDDADPTRRSDPTVRRRWRRRGGRPAS